MTVVISKQILRRLRVKLLRQGRTVSSFVREQIIKFLEETKNSI